MCVCVWFSRYPNSSTQFTDGREHHVMVAMIGMYYSVEVDGVWLGGGALLAPISDVSDSIFLVGQRAPGAFRFSGVVTRLDVGGISIGPRILGQSIPGIMSVGRVWRFDGVDGVSGGMIVSAVSSSAFSIAVTVQMETGSRGYARLSLSLSLSLSLYVCSLFRLSHSKGVCV